MEMDYECHVTVSCPEPRVKDLQTIIESVGWSFSKIAGDPLLGASVFCYATHHYDDLRDAISYSIAMSQSLQMAEFNVRRRKVELVMMDEVYIQDTWVRKVKQ